MNKILRGHEIPPNTPTPSDLQKMRDDMLCLGGLIRAAQIVTREVDCLAPVETATALSGLFDAMRDLSDRSLDVCDQLVS